MKRAYATLDVKAAQTDGKRLFTGIATTIATDRMDDIVVPDGAKFKLPLPLLWQHCASEPIGWVRAARMSGTKIEVDCEIHDEPQPGNLKDRCDEAWQSLKSGLVRGLSIGFNPIETSNIDGSWGVKFLEWEWLELSAVTIAANADASVQSIKAIDRRVRAASGRREPGDPVRLITRLASGHETPTRTASGAVKLIPKEPK